MKKIYPIMLLVLFCSCSSTKLLEVKVYITKEGNKQLYDSRLINKDSLSILKAQIAFREQINSDNIKINIISEVDIPKDNSSIILNYILSFLAILISSLSIFISYKWNRKVAIENKRPILVVSNSSSNQGQTFEILNIGNGPALNIKFYVFGFKEDTTGCSKGEWFDYEGHIESLAKNNSKKIRNPDFYLPDRDIKNFGGSIFALTYTDFQEKGYSSVYNYGKIKISEGIHIITGVVIKKYKRYNPQ